MSWLVNLIAQVAPADGQQWVNSIVSGLGGAGVGIGILWKVHAEDRKTISSLTARLFLLADRATDLGKTAVDVAKNDANDPALMAEMQRLIALIEERGR